jgi:regulator of replication initiation timing
MDENIFQLMFEQLKHIRKTVERTAEDVQDLKLRVSSLERSTALLHLDIAQINGRLDGFDKLFYHIEKRLELQEMKTPREKYQNDPR